MAGEAHDAQSARAAARLLPYERQLLEELGQTGDALVIMAAGLTWCKAAAALVCRHAGYGLPGGDAAAAASAASDARAPPVAGEGQQQDGTQPPPPPPPQQQQQQQQPAGTLLIVGTTPAQRALISSEVARLAPGAPQPVEITAEVASAERFRHYTSGAACYVTTRILVVDFLSSRVRGSQVARMVVANAHKVTDDSGEGFAVRLYREGRPRGPLTAFSDAPHAFRVGFNKLEKVMRALQLRRLLLFPRFHEVVDGDLGADPAELEEWQCPVSDGQRAILEAVAAVLTALLRDLARTNRVDVSDLLPQPDDGLAGPAALLSRNLSAAARRQLDAGWPTLPWRTRQAVADLATVQGLAAVAMDCDAVTLLSHLENLRQSEAVRSVWMFLDGARAIFSQARRRVYQVEQAGAAGVAEAAGAARPAGPAGGRGRGGRRGRGTGSEGRGAARQGGRGGRGAKRKQPGRGRGPGRGDSHDGNSSGGSGSGSGIDDWDSDRGTEQARRQRRRTDGAAATAAGEDGAAGPLGQQGGGGGGASRAGAPAGQGLRVVPVLEPPAKWAALAEALADIRAEREAMARYARALPPEGPPAQGGQQQQGQQGQQQQQQRQQQQQQQGQRPGPQEEGASTAMELDAGGWHAQGPGGGGHANGGSGGGGGARRETSGAALRAGGPGSGGGGAASGPPEGVEVVELLSSSDEDDHAGRCGREDTGGEEGGGPPFYERYPRAALLEAAGAPVLVIARDPGTADQLAEVLADGGAAVMRRQFDRYLVAKLEGAAAPAGAARHAQRRAAGGDDAGGGGGGGTGGGAAARGGRGGRRGRGRGRGWAAEDDRGRLEDARAMMAGPGVPPSEHQALLAEARRVRDAGGAAATEGGDAAAGTGQKTAGGSEGGRRGGRGGGRGGRRGRAAGAAAGDESPRQRGRRRQHEEDNGSSGSDDGGPSDSGGEAAGRALPGNVVVVSLEGPEAWSLWSIMPGAVVVYDADLALVRRLEAFKAETPGRPLRVHQLSYEDSPEVAAFTAAAGREVDAFDHLAECQARLALPLDMGVGRYQMLEPFRLADEAGPSSRLALPAPPPAAPDPWLDVYAQNQLTRAGMGAGPLLAGGALSARAQRAAPRRLVVDVREFMAALPGVLHRQGFHLAPVTLEVGDYLLSPDVIVERKAVPDLIQSLASGRLYSQAEAMCRAYRTPVLLVEFDPGRAFALTGGELGDDPDGRSPQARLALLLLHFPRLRVVWSRSQEASGEVFLDLKKNRDEPDPVAAALVGLPLAHDGTPLLGAAAAAAAGGGVAVATYEAAARAVASGAAAAAAAAAGGAGASVAAAAEAAVNQPGIELLRRLPGVTDANWRPLAEGVGSLAGLADASLARLAQLMGGARAAGALHAFLHAPCPRLAGGPAGGGGGGGDGGGDDGGEAEGVVQDGGGGGEEGAEEGGGAALPGAAQG